MAGQMTPRINMRAQLVSPEKIKVTGPINWGPAGAPGVEGAALPAFGAEAPGVEPEACLPDGALLAADLPAEALPFEAAGADGEAGDDGLAAGVGDGAAADESSALGVDGLALGAAGVADCDWSADFDEAFLEPPPPEQAAPSMARVLNRAT